MQRGAERVRSWRHTPEFGRKEWAPIFSDVLAFLNIHKKLLLSRKAICTAALYTDTKL